MPGADIAQTRDGGDRPNVIILAAVTTGQLCAQINGQHQRSQITQRLPKSGTF
jgi:hypothetical protein